MKTPICRALISSVTSKIYIGSTDVLDNSSKEKRKTYFNVGFEVLTAVVMKSIIFWDITPGSPLSFSRRFGGTYRLRLQGRRNLLACWFC
jgi:hypothetical protein